MERLVQRPNGARWRSCEERVDVRTPLPELRQAHLAVPATVGHIVDGTAEPVDFEHGATLCGRQHPHRGVERAAGHRFPRVPRRGFDHVHLLSPRIWHRYWEASRITQQRLSSSGHWPMYTPLPFPASATHELVGGVEREQ